MLKRNDRQTKAALLRELVREPLLHFLILGGLVFAADRFAASRKPNPNQIVVAAQVTEEASALFKGARGREPTPAELAVLRERWIDNEVLYREGLALRLDQGDPTLRDRVIFKALNVIESNLRLPEPDDATLRDWFEHHREQYEVPARYDFAEAVLSDTSEPTARRFAEALNREQDADIQSGLRLFEKRPENTIVDAFGSDFAQALAQVPLAEWHVLPSKDGPKVVRLQARQAGESARFEDVRQRVQQDWRDAKAQELRTAAVRELSKKYTIVREVGAS